MRRVVLASLMFSAAAVAVPPPPPLPGDAATLREFIRALQSKDVAAYSSTLADDVEVIEGSRILAHSKAEWLRTVAEEFSRPNRVVKSEGVWAGYDVDDRRSGQPYKALILERDDQIFGDCCVAHRTELLTFKERKISKIELSPSLNLQMRNDGRRQDE